jgi:hypothetical protein
MAAIRPVVLVFQDFATPTVVTSTPDLNVLVVGPAYHIQDYYEPGTTTYEDKDNIELSTAYGALEAPVGDPTPTGVDVITVADPPNNVVGAVLDEDSVVVYFDETTAIIVEGTAGVTATATPNQFDVTDGFDWTTGNDKIVPGDRIILTDGSSNTIVRTVYTVDAAQQLHFTEDIPTSGWVVGACEWRVERTLEDQVVDASFYDVNGNTIDINGSITLAVNGQGPKTISYAKVYIEYRSLRQDLRDLLTIASLAEITANLGRLDTRNPLAVGVFVAQQNTTSIVQAVGVLTDDLAGYTTAKDDIAARSDVYAIIPLIVDTDVINMWKVDCEGLALPDESTGRPQRFRVVIGSGELPVTGSLVDPKMGDYNEVVAGTAPVTITEFEFPTLDLVTLGVIPGDVLIISADTAGTPRNATYAVSAVLSATKLEVSTAAASADTADAVVEITGKVVAGAAISVITALCDDLFLLLRDDSGTFLTSSLQAGDIVQIAADFTNTFDGSVTLSSFVVASILSENRLLIANNGKDTPTTQNELPHGVIRTGSTLVPTGGTIYYQVVRTLTKTNQVVELIALAQSFISRRTVLVWPDIVDVAGVVDGDSQPGYYASCAVGGMTAGLPAHQGFTFLGIAGISRIYNSNTYFSDLQLTDLSNGGWYVFAQQTTSSLPYTIHQLTTDPSTLESGEFSVVKNFDFVSLYFVDILETFLGVYNVTSDTIMLIRAALAIGGETLLLRSFAKIGAPLTSFSITDLAVSPISSDRINAYLAVGLPKPLNVIELHLVA